MKKKKENKEKNWKEMKSNDTNKINRYYLLKNMITLRVCCSKDKTIKNLGILF
jgi:hypothetical protein